jgi:hypothetical protein
VLQIQLSDLKPYAITRGALTKLSYPAFQVESDVIVDSPRELLTHNRESREKYIKEHRLLTDLPSAKNMHPELDSLQTILNNLDEIPYCTGTVPLDASSSTLFYQSIDSGKAE